MNVQRRDFLLLVTIVSAISTSAWTQAVSPAAAPAGSSARSAASMPDFSGTWAHPYLTGFEQPATGPGPVRNRSRRRDGVANFQQLVGDYTNPILQPWAAEVVKKHGEISLAGQGYPTPSNQCWPGGVPYVFWDFLLQIFQQPDHILMVYRQGHELRYVRMNEPHPAQVTPSWYGDSVGHYEGDTLVIDTVGIKVGPFAMRRQRRLGAQRQRELVRPSHRRDGCRGDRSQLPRQGAATPLYGRGQRGVHRALDGDHHLPAQPGPVDRSNLRGKPPMVLWQELRGPADR